MRGHPVLAPLRRWLIEPGSARKAIGALVLILLAASAAFLAVRNAGSSGQ